MKPWVRLVIAVVVLAAVVAVLFWPKKPAVVKTTPPLASINVNDVGSLSIAQPAQPTVALVKAGKDWKLSQPYAYPADAAAVASLLSSLGDITGAQAVGSASNLAAFGLDHPSTVTLGQGSGKATEFEFGSDTPTGGNTYMRLGDSGPIEMVPSEVKSNALKSAFDLQDKIMLHFPEGELTSLSATAHGKTVKLAKSNGAWPKAQASNVQSLVDSFTDGQMTAMPDPSGKAAGADGLVHPAITLTLVWKGGAAQLDVGSKKGAAEYYARNSASPAIFTISDYLVTDITNLVTPPKSPEVAGKP